jgi:hypothetical protein
MAQTWKVARLGEHPPDGAGDVWWKRNTLMYTYVIPGTFL